MKQWFLMAISYGLISVAIAQEKYSPSGISAIDVNPFMPISVSYYGNLITHPGIKIAIDKNLFAIEKLKPKKNKTVVKLLYAQPNVSFYAHPKSHSGLLVALDLGWRRYGNRLFYTDIAIGAGYLRRFNLGETYVVDADGVVTEAKKGTSRGYFTPSASFAFGKAFNTKQEKNFSIFTRVNSNFVIGYSAGTNVELSIELGARIPFEFGIKHGEYKTIKK